MIVCARRMPPNRVTVYSVVRGILRTTGPKVSAAAEGHVPAVHLGTDATACGVIGGDLETLEESEEAPVLCMFALVNLQLSDL